MNKVKYAKVRKFRDVGFNEIDKKEIHTTPKKHIPIKKKLGFFAKIKKAIKSIFKK